MTTKQRRPRNEGGVHWDEKRERWIAERTVGYDTRGKRIRRKASGTSKSAALRELAKRVKSYEAGLAVGSEFYKVSDAMRDWFEYGQGNVDDETRKRNKNMIDNHIIPKLGGRKLRELRADEVDRWMHDLAPRLSTSSLRRVRWILQRSVMQAMRRDMVDRNVVDLCQVPRGREGRKSKSLTMEHAQAVVANTIDDPLHAYIVMSLLTGARTEELRALRWEHVHLEADPPHVEVWHSVRRSGDTKTPKSRRTIALPALVTQRLREHRVRQAEFRLKSTTWADPGIVFATSNGTAMDAANVRRDFRRALKLVPGIDPDDWTPRDLRHSFVSLLSASGLSIEDIARAVGHRGTRVTEQVYRHELRPIIETGATAMDALFDMPSESDETR
ncbi:site-specific integrase [Nocardioides cavernaquae]|uniref:Site-specific integrase n=1 Tax=Nocardioides cavernaquae TaxID=2321396 RepID=A0A3A5HHV2_9ACTN|nr:site-specific integrase [Nocardioides cavernaquae]RJS47460.1 site-specific integrase [Nocardioides cavernaquae]